jgi:hypothetical protein
MINNKFRGPKGNIITIRMFVIPKNQQQAAPGNSFGLADPNEKRLSVDEARTGDKKFYSREIKMTGWLMSSVKKFNALLLYEEVHHYNPLVGLQDITKLSIE